ncbi:uncharacterized protein LOC124491832 isoform X1 [Dermatophagoides farinae]|uniref:uncharacterized protein LOC124491832 isoform X1 n=1 Tax=Dermatophagoides farinae TaxID=6954 RepID=UPI001F0E7F2F|nr:uncharacterized protein LOC124491832 isoform X1 [Dermatophagoides farinae]
MFQLIKTFLDQLLSSINLFARYHRVPASPCHFRNSLFSIHINDTDSPVKQFTIECEWRTSSKQSFDIRLSFRNHHLRSWWPLLSNLEIELRKISEEFILPISFITRSLNALDIQLDRPTVFSRLLNDSTFDIGNRFLSSFDTHFDQIVLIKLKPKSTNYFNQRRSELLVHAVENFVSLTQAKIIQSHEFDKFLASLKASEASLSESCIYFQLIHSYLFESLKFDDKIIDKVCVIITTLENESYHVDSCQRLFSEKLPNITLKVIKIGNVLNTDHFNHIHSYDQFKHCLEENDFIDSEQVSQENLDSIVKTMELWTLLSPYPNKALSLRNLEQFRSKYNQSIFVHYNLARIQSIVEKFRLNFSRDIKIDANFMLLSNEFEWTILWIYMVRLQAMNETLIEEIFHRYQTTFNSISKIIVTIDQLCHQFSRYYRSIRILLPDSSDKHLEPLIATRVEFCSKIRKQIQFYFHQSFRIKTIDKI